MISVVSLIITFLGIISMLIMGLLVSKSNAKTKYNMEKRVKNINYKKVIKVWIFLQILILLTFKKDTTLDYIIIILTPLILMCLILVNAIFSHQKGEKFNKDEFEIYKKSFIRNKKIDEIIN